MDALKLFFFFEKAKPSHTTQNVIKTNDPIPVKTPETSLRIYKNSFFNSYREKATIPIATNMEKKLFCSILSGCYETQS